VFADLERLEEALATLGEVLTERAETWELLVGGGGSLLLLGLVDRPTADIDVVGRFTPHGYAKLAELPAYLAEAAGDVGDALGIGRAWLNTGPAGLVDFGLPPGLEDRVEVRRYGALALHIPAREDLVAFKPYAAVDLGERSKHFQDLQRLAPTPRELIAAAAWTRTHDPSPGYLGELKRVLRLFGVEYDDASA
jgi:hypothetical protein